ncbi:MAG: hypothetical protein RL038_836 [Actinomycetota bacterium]|jgi:putative endonuclease
MIFTFGMTKASKSLGSWGEDFAVRHLLSSGYQILFRNWRSPAGEVDIVAEIAETIIFCEVKTRTDFQKGHPTEAVNSNRISRLRNAALLWPNPKNKNLRIDVFAISLAGSLQFHHFIGV